MDIMYSIKIHIFAEGDIVGERADIQVWDKIDGNNF